MGMVRYISWGLGFAVVALLAYAGPAWFGLHKLVLPAAFVLAGVSLHIGYRWGRGYWMGEEPSDAGSQHQQRRR